MYSNFVVDCVLVQEQLLGVEGVLFISSLCVLVLLIFLCVIARLALKSTHTQVKQLLIDSFFKNLKLASGIKNSEFKINPF